MNARRHTVCAVHVKADSYLLTVRQVLGHMFILRDEQRITTPASGWLSVELGDTYKMSNYNSLKNCDGKST